MMLGSFQCWGVMLIQIIVGQGPTVLAVDMGKVVPIFVKPACGKARHSWYNFCKVY